MLSLSAGLEVEAEDEEEAVGIELGGTTAYPWEGTDRDYKYDEVSLIYFQSAVPCYLCRLGVLSVPSHCKAKQQSALAIGC